MRRCQPCAAQLQLLRLTTTLREGPFALLLLRLWLLQVLLQHSPTAETACRWRCATQCLEPRCRGATVLLLTLLLCPHRGAPLGVIWGLHTIIVCILHDGM